jgi:hypothetical protein
LDKVRPQSARGLGFANLRVSRPGGVLFTSYAFKSLSNS